MFTIIIPTNERHGVLLRSIDYYQHFNCNVVIADSSGKKLDYVFPDNVIYRHFPGLSFAKKLLEVAEDVTTPYVCMSADDDYIIESGLQAGARFLSDNLDFVSVQGRYLRLELIEGQVVFSPRYREGDSRYAVTDEDIFSRVVNAYNLYMHHVFSVQRTDVFVRSFRSCADISVNLMLELATILVPMCYGKHKVLPMLWMVRDTHVFYRPDAYQNDPAEKSNHGSIPFIYKSHKNIVSEVESFLDSEESQLVKKKFASNISGLVGSGKESDRIFYAAFKSFTNWVISNRNKVIMILIIKSIIPARVLNYFMKPKTAKHMGGNEKDSPDKEALEKIRLSVLAFVKCYDKNI